MADLEEQLRRAGEGWRAQQDAPAVDVVLAATRSRSRRAVVAVSVGVIVLVPAVMLLAIRANDSTRTKVNVAPATTVPASDVIELSSEIVQPDVLAVDGDLLWVTGYAAQNGTVPGRAAHLQEIDSRTGRLLGDVTLPDDAPGEIRVGDGAVWVAAQQGEESTELLKIDIETMKIVARIPGAVSSGFAVAADAVWASDGVGGLRRIDPATGRVVATIDLHSNHLYPPGFVVAGSLGVFVGNGYNHTIQRIDTTTNTAGPEISVPGFAGDMVELGDSLWVQGSTGSRLTEIAGGAQPRPPIELGERTLSLASDGTALWLGTESARVLRVDPTTGSVSRVALPSGTLTYTVAADSVTGAVWATSTKPTPRLLRVPSISPTSAPAPTSTVQSSTTTVQPGCGVGENCPLKGTVPPCPPNQTEPSMNGRYCGPTPPAGNGLGPAGLCTGQEKAPPCGPGMVAGRYYAYTLPGTCDGRLILDGRHWLSFLPPPTNGPSMNVWVSIFADRQGAGFISPAGAVGFEPDTGQPVPACRGAG